MLFLPDERPRPGVFGCVLAETVLGTVMFRQASVQIVGLPDVEAPVRILDNVHKERQTPRVGLEPTT